MGNRGMTPLILNLGLKWGLVVSFMSQLLYVGYPLSRMLCGLRQESKLGSYVSQPSRYVNCAVVANIRMREE
jgi:hypothetical protein